MALFLIGTGVAFDLTLAGIDALKSCDEAYIETYTNPIEEGKIAGLERLIGKKLEHLGRDRLEGPYLVQQAKTKSVCILASGDPLTATTHITLVLEARQKGVKVLVIHNSSIHSVAPARAGLQVYRFGKTASLVNPRPNYKPLSSLDIIRENLVRDLHTLVLLDTEPAPMEAAAALDMLAEFSHAIVLSRVGHEDEKISYGAVPRLKEMPLGRPPFTIIVPARLHPVEQEYLDSLV
ncbi:MAG: diphthine synthase [Candidatus Micrarchaeota archaeon]